MTKIVLCCDGGGGIRAIAIAQFLAELEKDLNVSAYDLFDGFCGTNTGALVVLSISHSKMSAQNIIDKIFTNANLKKMMNKSGWRNMAGLAQNKPLYSEEGKRSLFTEAFGKSKIKSTSKFSVIPLYDLKERKISVFGSEDSQFDTNPLVSEICNAATAIPVYFPSASITIENRDGLAQEKWFIDSSIVSSDPSFLMAARSKLKWQNENIKVLSIGCGYSTKEIPAKESQTYGAVDWLQHGLLDVACDALHMEEQARVLFGDLYFRVNSSLGSCNDEIDDISAENIESLKQLGTQWYQQYRSKLIEFLGIGDGAKQTKDKKKSKKESEKKKKLKKEKEEEKERKEKEEKEKEKEKEKKEKEEKERKDKEEKERKEKEEKEKKEKEKEKKKKKKAETESSSEEEEEEEEQDKEEEKKKKKKAETNSISEEEGEEEEEEEEEEDDDDDEEEDGEEDEDDDEEDDDDDDDEEDEEDSKDKKKKKKSQGDETDSDDDSGCVLM